MWCGALKGCLLPVVRLLQVGLDLDDALVHVPSTAVYTTVPSITYYYPWLPFSLVILGAMLLRYSRMRLGEKLARRMIELTGSLPGWLKHVVFAPSEA